MEETTTRDLTVYVLARTDLPSMLSGKLAAQVHHSGIQMMSKFGHHSLVQAYIADGMSQGAQHFNTTIVLGATIQDIERVSSDARVTCTMYPDMILHGVVTDPSYPFFVENTEVADLIPEHVARGVKLMSDGRVLMTREEVTCAWFIGDRNQPEFRSLFEGLNLHP